MTLTSLDDKDLKIIEQLKENARLSVRDLGKKTRIRPSTVHQRIQRLIKEGVIKSFTVKLDPEKIGENLTVFMLVAGALDKYFDDRFMRSKHILEIHGITGEYDILLKLRFKDMKQFNKFVIDFRDRYSRSISKTTTMVQTVPLKE
ncbi:Lrp/AsnC family transcriptional regulator [[Eubacterium] cellulosolvens]